MNIYYIHVYTRATTSIRNPVCVHYFSLVVCFISLFFSTKTIYLKDFCFAVFLFLIHWMEISIIYNMWYICLTVLFEFFVQHLNYSVFFIFDFIKMNTQLILVQSFCNAKNCLNIVHVDSKLMCNKYDLHDWIHRLSFSIKLYAYTLVLSCYEYISLKRI